MLHNQEDVNIDRYVLRKLSTRSFENALYDIRTFLVVEHLGLESLSRGCAKTPILTVYDIIIAIFGRWEEAPRLLRSLSQTADSSSELPLILITSS